MTSRLLLTILSVLLWVIPAYADIDSLLTKPRLSTDAILLLLDNELRGRDRYIARRQEQIDSLRRELLLQPDNYDLMEQLGSSYASFNNDSTISVYTKALEKARSEGRMTDADRFLLLRVPHLPLGGFIPEAINEYESIDTTLLDSSLLPLYYDMGRQMYSHIGAFYVTFPETRQDYERKSNEAQRHLLSHLDKSTPKYMLNAGESLYNMGEYPVAVEVLEQIIDSLPSNNNIYARAAHILSDIARISGDDDDYLYYLALSALSDLRSATLEVTSLQELGAMMYDHGDVERAHDYLSVALQNAVKCHAETRMLQTAMELPLIESVHRSQLDTSRRRMKIIIAAMVVMVVSLAVALILYHRQSKASERLRDNLERASRTKDVYINQFLNLCSSYMDKLNQFSRIVERKISAGKADELLQLTHSGKFIENQTKEFYEVFDSAFLHIYPDFVEKVNKLLQPDRQIVQRDKTTLNTDLRILAFMRMGIDDSGRIAELLNYSINTIYTYRNKLKNCAISRETFESDIRKL